jgi:hypothetical protein
LNEVVASSNGDREFCALVLRGDLRVQLLRAGGLRFGKLLTFAFVFSLTATEINTIF